MGKITKETDYRNFVGRVFTDYIYCNVCGSFDIDVREEWIEEKREEDGYIGILDVLVPLLFLLWIFGFFKNAGCFLIPIASLIGIWTISKVYKLIVYGFEPEKYDTKIVHKCKCNKCGVEFKGFDSFPQNVKLPYYYELDVPEEAVEIGEHWPDFVMPIVPRRDSPDYHRYKNL